MLKFSDLQYGCPKCGFGHYATSNSVHDGFIMTYVPKYICNSKLEGIDFQGNDQEYLLCECRMCAYSFQVQPFKSSRD